MFKSYMILLRAHIHIWNDWFVPCEYVCQPSPLPCCSMFTLVTLCHTKVHLRSYPLRYSRWQYASIGLRSANKNNEEYIRKSFMLTHTDCKFPSPYNVVDLCTMHIIIDMQGDVIKNPPVALPFYFTSYGRAVQRTRLANVSWIQISRIAVHLSMLWYSSLSHLMQTIPKYTWNMPRYGTPGMWA